MPAGVAKALNALLANYASYAAASEAFITAAERAQGASRAGDKVAAGKQIDAAVR